MKENRYNEIFSKNLMYFLNQQNKKQSDLCKDLKIPKSTVSSWCRGTRLPKLETIFELGNYLNLSDATVLIKERVE